MTEINKSLRQKMQESERSDKIFTLLLLVLVGFAVVFFALFNFVFFLVTVDGPSMENTLHNQDVVLVNKYAKVDRGDVVIIDKGEYWVVKRVIAIAGDTVKIGESNGKVYLKKQGEQEFSELHEEYIKQPNSTYSENPLKFEWTVEEGEVFYLGDNRKNSTDSRDAKIGCVSVNEILGVVPQWAISIKSFTTKVFSGLVSQ